MKEILTEFFWRILELEGNMFDVVSVKNADNFEVILEDISQYAGKRSRTEQISGSPFWKRKLRHSKTKNEEADRN